MKNFKKNGLHRVFLFTLTVLLSGLVEGVCAQTDVMWWAQGTAKNPQVNELDQQQTQYFLQEVLLRVVGTVSVFRNAGIQAMLTDPDRYVVSHSLTPATSGHPVQQAVEFSEAQIRDQLQRLAVVPWIDRPKILVLWVEDSKLHPLPPALSASLLAEARLRGIPLAVPQSGTPGVALNPAGSHLFSAPSTLWRNLSAHSGVDGVLLIQMDTSAVPEKIRWRIVTRSVDRQFIKASDDVLSFWPFLADQTAEVLVGQQLCKEATEDKIEIQVDGVQHYLDWDKVERQLKADGYTDLELLGLDRQRVRWLGVQKMADAERPPVRQSQFPSTVPLRWINAWVEGTPDLMLRWNGQKLLP